MKTRTCVELFGYLSAKVTKRVDTTFFAGGLSLYRRCLRLLKDQLVLLKMEIPRCQSLKAVSTLGWESMKVIITICGWKMSTKNVFVLQLPFNRTALTKRLCSLLLWWLQNLSTLSFKRDWDQFLEDHSNRYPGDDSKNLHTSVFVFYGIIESI